jgi:hypothetical protein
MSLTDDEYCREIEAYLCRKNDGHLIRIVGPSFERVRGWAAQGIPLKIAFQGIDRYFVRYYAKGPRRRPVQIDFCDADVNDAFDAWRRAVGVRLPGTTQSGDEAGDRKRRRSLPEHLNRVLERLTAVMAVPRARAEALERLLESTANEIASLSEQAGPFRGEARARVGARLAELDRALLDGARQHADAAVLAALRQEAADELAPFRERMPKDAYDRAFQSAVDRLLRDREQLPTVSFD